MSEPAQFASFAAFWPHYLGEHSEPWTRRLHIAGTSVGGLLLVAGIATLNPWLVLAAPLSGYAAAWISHMAIEHNRPATFRYPLWSLRGDLRMALLWWQGRLAGELARHRVP